MWVVTFGTIVGHSLCTLGAVLGGRWLATKISIRNVTFGGAVLFLIFGVACSSAARIDQADRADAYEAYAWTAADDAAEVGLF